MAMPVHRARTPMAASHGVKRVTRPVLTSSRPSLCAISLEPLTRQDQDPDLHLATRTGAVNERACRPAAGLSEKGVTRSDPATTPTPLAAPEPTPVPPADFVRAMTLGDATMLAMGSMIGSGIFIVSAGIARAVGS